MLLGLNPLAKAQLFPDGTKLHVAHLGSYSETWYQQYLTTDISNTKASDDRLYTQINYPDWRHSQHLLRIDSNKLFEASGAMLFDFNAKKNDSVSIYQYVFHIGNYQTIRNGPARIKIDSIVYTYYLNENDQRDSLKVFLYSGTVTIPADFFSDEETYSFRSSIIEKIITISTSGSMSGYLSINVGPRTLSDDHELLRCIEFPDGRRMRMEWWYKMAGNTIPCNYTFNVGQQELTGKSNIVAYPNPTTQFINLDGYLGPVSIYNIMGQKVLQVIAENETPIDVRSLKEGLYYISLATAQQRIQIAIIH